VFTAASMTSGLAQTPLMLIVARAGQGAGAALLTPAALSIIMTTYAGRQRQTALAVWGAIGSTGIAAGVLFGGALTSALGWRAVFFINAPIGIVVIGGALRKVAHGRHDRGGRRRLDLRGAATLVAGLLLAVYAIEQTRTAGWTGTTTWLAFAGAAALLTTFAVLERRATNALVPSSTWRIRSLVSGSAVMAGVTGMVVGAIFLSSLYLQHVVGASPVVAGLEFLPLAAAITVAAAGASKLTEHIGPRTMIAAGLVVMAAGVLLLAGEAHGASYAADVLPGFLLIGAGVGPMFVAISIAAMSDVPPDKAGLASGLMMTGHEIGAALGVAILSAVASTAGTLTTAAGAADAYSRGFIGAAVMAALVAVFAMVRMPATRATDGGGHLHMH
jgi:MFS family permease